MSKAIFIAIIVVPILFIGVLFYNLITDTMKHDARVQEQWTGAVVVKICRSGKHIFKLHDGTFYTGGISSSRVTGPEVCE